MRRLLHADLLLLALMAGLVIGLFGAPTAAAKAENPGAQGYGACLNGQKKGEKQGDLLLLLDESISLQSTDPQGARVSAAQYFIGLLADQAKEKSIDFAVSVAGFSDDYHRALEWTPLDGDGARRVNSNLDEFKSKNQGVQTDYWNGLNGARSELSRRKKDKPDRCQALVWFSDGKFDVELSAAQWEANEGARTKRYASTKLDLRDPRDAERAKQAAEKDMCRGGGLADQLRIGKISMFAIGLTSGDVSETDFKTMANVATGSDSCGKRKKPPGSFTPAGDIDALLFALDKAINGGITPPPKLICQKRNPDQCRNLGHSVVLDNSVSRVHILASSDIAKAEVYLFYPGNSSRQPVHLSRDPVKKLRPSGSRYRWQTDRTLSIDLVNRDRKARPWTGQWTLVFFDPTASSQGKNSFVKINVDGNLYPAWPEAAATPLRTGEVVPLTFGLADDTGRAIEPTDLRGTGKFNAELIKADGSSQRVATDVKLQQVSGKDYTLDLTGVSPGRVDLEMSLAVTTASSGNIPGTELTPAKVSLALKVLPALGTPTLDPEVNFGAVEGPAEATAALGVNGPGCVWLPNQARPDIQTFPEGLGDIAITSPANDAVTCLPVAEGQRADLSLLLTTAEGGNGTLAGNVPITVSPLDRPDRATTVPVPFTADLKKPIDPVKTSLAFIAALILGPGIPLLLLALVKRITATIPGQPLLAREIPITISGGQVLRDGQPLALRDTDFRDLVPLKTGGSRTAEIPGGTLRTRTGWSPFGAGYVEADLPGRVALSSTHPRPAGRDKVARLPLAVHNTWIAARDPMSPPDSATLVLLAGLDATGARRQGLVNDVQARLPGLMPLLGATADGGGTQPTDVFAATGAAGSAPGPDVFGFGGDQAGGTGADPFASAWGTSGPTYSPPSGPATGPVDPFSQASAPTPSVPPPSPEAQPPDGPPQQPAPSQDWSFDSGFDDSDPGPHRP